MYSNVPTAMRALRARRRWRQADLGARAHLSRDVVSRIETHHLEGVTVGSLQRLARALDATLVIDLRWRGADLDRLVDRVHASLQEAAARRLGATGWMTRAEVSFNNFGDRGSCDLVAFHATTRAFLIVEVKSRLGNIQETLHRLDVKVRVGRDIAAQLGWPAPLSVVGALVLPNDRTARRQVGAHAALFSRFGLRGRRAFGWLRAPTSTASGVLWFEKSADSSGRRTMSAQRVRPTRSAG